MKPNSILWDYLRILVSFGLFCLITPCVVLFFQLTFYDVFSLKAILYQVGIQVVLFHLVLAICFIFFKIWE